jgi:predicted metal-dependent HD superfamily phosphohydrolase
VEGFLEGLYHVDFIAKDVTCFILHGETAFNAFNKTLDDIKKNRLFDGIKDLAVAFKEINSLLHNCYSQKHIEALIAQTEKIIELLSDPVNAMGIIGHRLVYQAQEVGADITKIARAYDRSDYYHFGYAIGDVQNVLLLGGGKSENSLEGLDIACLIESGKKLLANVKGVVAEFDGHSWSKLAQDVEKLVVEAVQDAK